MTGLSVLYAKEAAAEREWAAIPDRDRTGRLREVYWARRAEKKIGRKSFAKLTMSWQVDRTDIDRRGDEPGDGFVYLVEMTAQTEQRFEWLEVTEVFTKVPASQIEGAMRAWNGIPDRYSVDLEEFQKKLPRGRPSRTEQRRAADQVIAQIERKLAKNSYRELLEKYGYGTLVVGMPLWFAVPPDNPFRAENALDDFFTRTTLGLEDIKQRVLRRRDCPFRNVIVLWDTTPQAMRAWLETRSVEYDYAGNASLENPLGASIWGVLMDVTEKTISKAVTAESDAPSMDFHVVVKTRKKASGKGPYPDFVEALEEVLREHDDKGLMERLREMLRWKAASALCKLLCILRIRGLEGLEQWITRKFSLSHGWRAQAVRRKARLFYHKSKRRIRASNAGAR